MKIRNSGRRFLFVILFTCTLASKALAQESAVFGYWKEPGGGVIRVEHCGSDVCAVLVDLSSDAPGHNDGHNPDPAKRQRSLCGMRIGEGFHLKSNDKAEDGTLYDPKSGKTYRGIMTSHGDHLDLRGYIGISLFGRSERWNRNAAVPTCNF